MRIAGIIILTIGWYFYAGLGVAIWLTPIQSSDRTDLLRENEELSQALRIYFDIEQKPPFAEQHSDDTVIPTDSSFVEELNQEWECLPAKMERTGFLDQWGNPYFLLLDYDGDRKLTEPARLGNLTFDDTSFLLWSNGPDGKYGTPETNRDNYYNYPGHVENYFTLPDRQMNTLILKSIQFQSSGIIAAWFWIIRFRTYPLLAGLFDKMFASRFRQHLWRVRYFILPLVVVEVLTSLISLYTIWFVPIVFSSIFLLLACLHLVFFHLPRLKSPTPERIHKLADLTTIPLVLWTVKILLIFAP